MYIEHLHSLEYAWGIGTIKIFLASIAIESDRERDGESHFSYRQKCIASNQFRWNGKGKTYYEIYQSQFQRIDSPKRNKGIRSTSSNSLKRYDENEQSDSIGKSTNTKTKDAISWLQGDMHFLSVRAKLISFDFRCLCCCCCCCPLRYCAVESSTLQRLLQITLNEIVWCNFVIALTMHFI